MNVIRRRGVYHGVGNHVRAFSRWRARTGSSNISQSMALSKTVKDIEVQPHDNQAACKLTMYDNSLCKILSVNQTGSSLI